MKQREIYAEVDRLAAERGWETGDYREVFLLELLTAREDARNSLTTKIAALARDLSRLDDMLRTPSPIMNELGELQQKPAQVEAAVGAFAQACRTLESYLKTFPPQEVAR